MLVRTSFALFSLHAKMHNRLDALSPVEQTLRRIEEKEILAYDDNARFSELELLKQELLRIRFLE